jgi:probable HAF family extracellular repeat protein
MKTKHRLSIHLTIAVSVFTLTASAQTYRVTALSTNDSFATGINASGQVSGYSVAGSNAARAWRFSPGVGLVDVGSFGGADNRALGINNSGQVIGYSTDTNGVAHGFVFNGTLTDIGGTNVFHECRYDNDFS